MRKILVIDDTLSDIEMISRYLKAVGYLVFTESESSQAIAAIKTIQPDLIITDIVMPSQSGLELARAIKRDPELTAIPIIACTSKDADIDRLWALKQGIAQYIIKPFTPDQIVHAVEALLY